MTNTQSNSSQSNIVSVLYQSQIKRNSVLDQDLTHFIADYQTVQRSLWSGNDNALNRSLRNFLITCSIVNTRDWFSSAFFLIIPVFEQAVQDKLTLLEVDNQGLQALFPYIPEDLQLIWEEVLSDFRQMRQQRSLRPVERASTNTTQSETTSSRRDDTSQAELLWYETDPGIISVVNFTTEFRSAKRLFDTNFGNASIYGLTSYEDDSTSIIHLISLNQNYDALKSYVEGIIYNLRKEYNAFTKREDPPKLRWREEYAREIFKNQLRPPFIIGESWDEFPYPHPTRNLPGITTWLAKDGRAEIIVRKREK